MAHLVRLFRAHLLRRMIGFFSHSGARLKARFGALLVTQLEYANGRNFSHA